MTLLELLTVAKGVTFKPPVGKSYDQYNYDEIIHVAMSESLKNDLIIFGVIQACQKYSMIKHILKAALKEYIRLYGDGCAIPGKHT